MDKKLIINLTPKIKIKIKIKDGEKALNRITLDSKGITYLYDYDYSDEVAIKDMENQTIGNFVYTNTRKEIGRLKRDHVTAVTRSSHISVIEDENKEHGLDTEIEHVLMIEGINSNITMTCTFDELKKYYPIIEDYYMGGSKWEEQADKENKESNKDI